MLYESLKKIFKEMGSATSQQHMCDRGKIENFGSQNPSKWGPGSSLLTPKSWRSRKSDTSWKHKYLQCFKHIWTSTPGIISVPNSLKTDPGTHTLNLVTQIMKKKVQKSIKNHQKLTSGPQGGLLGVPMHPWTTKMIPKSTRKQTGY